MQIAIFLAVIYVLGVVIVLRRAEDPMHRIMAPIWPITILLLML